jgi:hypothetical protein
MATAKKTLARALRYLSVTAGDSDILDLRALAGEDFPNAFVIYLNGGTATYQPCDLDGTVVPGSASADAVSGTLIPAQWPFYKVTATAAACVAAGVQGQAVKLEAGDIEIGAVELKNAADDTRAAVGDVNAHTATSHGLPVATYPIPSEVHVGEVGGKMLEGSDTFDALAAGDYAANDVIAADAENTGTTPLRGVTVARANGGTGYLVSARLTTNNASWTAGIRVDLYSVAAPTTALTGDNVAAAPKFANNAQFVGTFNFDTMSTPTGSDFRRGIRDDLRIPFKCAAADTKLYYRLVTLAADANEAAGQDMVLTLIADLN